jgi:nucleotidyltransferase/DNA polymerase involved in DNA repair
MYISYWKKNLQKTYFYSIQGIQQKYIVVTCNYKAREYGVTKLMSIKDAKDKCPQLILVNGEDLTHYREMSYKISGKISFPS